MDANSTGILELVVDLSMTDDIDLEACLVGYAFTSAGSTEGPSVSTVRHLMEGIGKGKRSLLDYVTLPVLLESSGAVSSSALRLRKSLQSDLGGQDKIKVGLDFSTSMLYRLSDVQVGALLSSLIADEALPAVTVASNCMTARQSRLIIAALRERGVPIVVSSEVLRVDASRPTLMAPFAAHAATSTSTATASVSGRRLTGGPSSGSSSDGGEVQPSKTAAATDDFKHAVDRCLTLERHFMDKLKPDLPAVLLTDLCWAHVLMQSHHTIQSPEEWQYLLEQQVMPKLDTAIDSLKIASKPASEWATLYAGMARYMFTTFSTLQARRAESCLDDIASALSLGTLGQSGGSTAAGPASGDDLPAHLGALVSSFGATSTLLAGCVVQQPASQMMLSPSSSSLSSVSATVSVSATEAAAGRAERLLVEVVRPLASKFFSSPSPPPSQSAPAPAPSPVPSGP